MDSVTLPPSLFAFLTDLESNNDRAWFHANKTRYVDEVQEPALEFITAFGPRLAKISPHFTADARVVGGSLFRIQRDTRFAKDKTPYKLNTGMQFRHEAGADVHAPGFYLHLQPGESFAGVGLWRPEAKVANQVRQAIADDPAGWKAAAHAKTFTRTWELGGDSLVRPPRGFDSDHPWIEDLKRKDFMASQRLTDEQVTAPGFIRGFSAMCTKSAPFMRFLCSAVGVAF